jgi:hypothetical protein
MIAPTLIATTSVRTISFKCELFEFMFWGGYGGRGWAATHTQTQHEEKTIRKRSI